MTKRVFLLQLNLFLVSLAGAQLLDGLVPLGPGGQASTHSSSDDEPSVTPQAAAPRQSEAALGFSDELYSWYKRLGVTDADRSKFKKFSGLNEFGNNPDGILMWNRGEWFPSLGIGHSIWYVEGESHKPIDESFRSFAKYILSKGKAEVDRLMSKHPSSSELIFGVEFPFDGDYSQLEIKAAPWTSKSHFDSQNRDYRMLKDFLLDPAIQKAQTDFIVDGVVGKVAEGHRLLAEKEILSSLGDIFPSSRRTYEQKLQWARERLQKNAQAMMASKAGFFAMTDYSHFKGAGIKGPIGGNPGERAKGIGWGLLQALVYMNPENPEPMKEFAHATTIMLDRRIQMDSSVAKFQKGWRKRTMSYGYDTKRESINAKRFGSDQYVIKGSNMSEIDTSIRDLF